MLRGKVSFEKEFRKKEKKCREQRGLFSFFYKSVIEPEAPVSLE